jgi:hypothetical protein
MKKNSTLLDVCNILKNKRGDQMGNQTWIAGTFCSQV